MHMSPLKPVTRMLEALALLSAVLAGSASAAEEVALEVAQPIWTQNSIEVSTVTYIVWLGSPQPGVAVRWTAKPNLVQREGNERPVNRNAASLRGIEVKVVEGAWARRGFTRRDTLDTLNVVLDLRRLHPGASSLADSLVVEATVECVLTNAAHDEVPVRYVDLRVEGSRRYGYLRRVYRMGEFAMLPRRRIFQ